MIVEYHRPHSLDDALNLLSRRDPVTVPLAGGTVINQRSETAYAVVDLQSLGLSTIERQGNRLNIGATATLQDLAEVEGIQPALARAIYHEATHNLRQVASVAGTLVAADGRSPFAVVMLALDASLRVQSMGAAHQLSLGEWIALRRKDLRGKLITQMSILLNVALAYEYVARTPADRPLVCAAVARWPSGRTRLALGGVGDMPGLALDGPEPGGVEAAASDVYFNAGDAWASSEYRQDVARILARRCLQQVLPVP